MHYKQHNKTVIEGGTAMKNSMADMKQRRIKDINKKRLRMLVNVIWSNNIKYQAFPSGGDFKSYVIDTQIQGCIVQFNLL